MSAPIIFKSCVEAIRNGTLIEKENASDKEFHFQNWFQNRLQSLNINYDLPGRNTYPDFRLVNSPEGYELKGLAYPGREADYDSNSQVPCGEHNGRQVYYAFGRYPAKPDGNKYPVLDFVLCHGSFLNADNTYVHKNKSFRGFGSYGDILVRDRKMYVAPTPFALVDGAAHLCTLILPKGENPGKDFIKVGDLIRKEVKEIIIAYQFDLTNNTLSTKTAPNPNAGKSHAFEAYRLKGDPVTPITIRSNDAIVRELMESSAEED